MYIYRTDVWCNACGEHMIRAMKAQELPLPFGYDSDNYPKGPFPCEEADCIEHCASESECLGDAIHFEIPKHALIGAETSTIGECLTKSLTEEGVIWLRDTLSETPCTRYQKALHTFWRETFADQLQEDC